MWNKRSATFAQFCGSRIPNPHFYPFWVPDPHFYPSWIPDLRSRIQQQQQKRRGKIFVYFWIGKEKKLSQFTKIYSSFYSKMVTKSQRYGFGIRKPRSEIKNPGTGNTYSGSRICDLVVKKAPDPRSESATLTLLKIQIWGSESHKTVHCTDPDPVIPATYSKYYSKIRKFMLHT